VLSYIQECPIPLYKQIILQGGLRVQLEFVVMVVATRYVPRDDWGFSSHINTTLILTNRISPHLFFHASVNTMCNSRIGFLALPRLLLL
jgi:hypothetical protein